MKNHNPSIVFSDLDETILPNQGSISESVWECFDRLGQEGIIRVIATGRNLFSARKAIPLHFPIDYLIFSTGIGCMNWKTGQILSDYRLASPSVQRLLAKIGQGAFPFFLLDPVPDNHFQMGFPGLQPLPEYYQRLAFYEGFVREYSRHEGDKAAVSQILIMVGKNKNEYVSLKESFPEESLILTSSPIQKGNFWVEIFPPGVSKGKSADWLCRYLGIDGERSLAVGNDYNDVDLLDWAAQKYLVANAPEDLHFLFPLAPSCDSNGFCQVINKSMGWKYEF